MSAEGRYALLTTDTDGLVAADDNGCWDVFLRDLTAHTTEYISVGASGEASSGESYEGYGESDLSQDERYVAFTSEASNLVPNGTTATNVYVRDRVAGVTELVSTAASGAPSIDAQMPRLSAEGRFVVFTSSDPEMVAGDTNVVPDVFLRDLTAGTPTERVSLGSAGQEPDGQCTGLGVSADGRYVLFTSYASNLAPGCVQGVDTYLFLRDCQSGLTTLLSAAGDGTPAGVIGGGSGGGPTVSMSDNGQLVTFIGGDLLPLDNDDSFHIYLWDPAARFYDLSSKYWAFPAVEACVAAHIVGGYPGGTYQPMEVVNRAQMAGFVARAMAGGDSHVPDPPPTPHFPDVPTNHWAYKYVEYAYANNIVNGYPGGSYGPDVQVDRGRMAGFVARGIATPPGEAGLAGYTPPTTPDFPDVPTSFWTYKHIEYLKDHSVVGGYPDGWYHPEVVCTRDQMAVFIARAFGLPM